MKRIIGFLLLIAISIGMFMLTEFAVGTKEAVISWAIALIIAVIICLAVYLII